MNAAPQTVTLSPSERPALLDREALDVLYVDPSRETVLRLRKQALSTAQVREAKRILNDAIDGLVHLNAFGAADLLIDLRNALANP